MGVTIAKSTMSNTPNAIDIFKGASKDVDIEIIKDSFDVDNNPVRTPFDLTGCTLIFTVRTTARSPVVVLYKISTDSAQIEISTTPLDGLAIIYILSSDTEKLEPGMYTFDVWVLEPSGKRYPVVLPSAFKVIDAVTHFNV